MPDSVDAPGKTVLRDDIHRNVTNNLCTSTQNISGQQVCIPNYSGMSQEAQGEMNRVEADYQVNVQWLNSNKQYIKDVLVYIDSLLHGDQPGSVNYLIQTNITYFMKHLYQVHWPAVYDPVTLKNGTVLTDALRIDNPKGATEVNGSKVPRIYQMIQAKDADLAGLGVPGYSYRCYGTTGSFCKGLGIDAFFLRFLSQNGDLDRLMHQAPANGGMFANYIQPYLLMQHDLIDGELKNSMPWLVTTVNVGSLAHDSCCEDSANSSGIWCGEASTELGDMENRGLVPPEGSGIVCSSEWRRAFFDTSHNLNWVAVTPLIWAEVIELAFVSGNNRTKATQRVIGGTRPRRRFSLPRDRLNMHYDLKPENYVTENKITFPGRCNALDDPTGPDDLNYIAPYTGGNDRCDDFDDFFVSLPKTAAEIRGMWPDISEANAQTLVNSVYSKVGSSDELYKIAKNMFRAPHHSQLPAIMSGSDTFAASIEGSGGSNEVAAVTDGSEVTDGYPTVWKDFCPTETISDGEPARDGRIQNTDPDNQTPVEAPILITEQFRQTIFCGEFTGPSAAPNVIPTGAPTENVYSIPLEMPAFSL